MLLKLIRFFYYTISICTTIQFGLAESLNAAIAPQTWLLVHAHFLILPQSLLLLRLDEACPTPANNPHSEIVAVVIGVLLRVVVYHQGAANDLF